ncbi:MAG: ABC transporter ATP-binding protein [Clostridia bacterium]|nr:ABC transporter ATP-binding protein [Clostridia bacterium]
MSFTVTLSNKPLPPLLEEQVRVRLLAKERILVALVGDLQLSSQYGNSALVVTDRRLFCVEENATDEGFFIDRRAITEVKVRRLYGNAVFQVNGTTVLRFSFAVVAFAEAIATFLSHMAKDGANEAEELNIITAFLEKKRCICPKCGRMLMHRGAPCVNCMNKGHLIKRLWQYMKPQKWRLLFCLLLSALTTTMALAPPFISRTLIDSVIPSKNLTNLYYLVILLFLVYAIQHISGALRAHHMRVAGGMFLTGMRNDIYRKAQYLPVTFYDKTSTGSIISRISGDTNVLLNFTLRMSQDAIVQFFTLIGIMAIMLFMDWKLAILSLIPIPAVVIGSRIFSKKIRPIYQRTWLRWSAISSLLTDTLPGVRVIKSFTAEKRTVEKFEQYNNEWLKEDRKASVAASIFPNTVSFFALCGSLVVWGIGGNWVMTSNNISLGLLVSFISYTSMFYGPVSFFANLSDSYQNMLTSAERLLDILDAEPEKNFGEGNNVQSLRGRIEFRHVSFSFDKVSKTLDDINLVIEPGDIVGIVGTTGSGKSTLINLLMRFYDQYDGEILVDGQDIRTIDLESYRSKIGFVQQEPLMFRDTVFKNIAFSNPDAGIEEVIHAADIANAHDFIVRLPDAYDTVLGERGTGLSGGERQRLSIARAILKNPSMLIFDEATASVDSETEHLIQGAIERLISGRTTLMIAHRLSTLRKANKIIVVDKGKILECGSHEELMKKQGKYYRLIQIQNTGDRHLDDIMR